MTTPYPDDDPGPPWPIGGARREAVDDRICRMVVDRLMVSPHLRSQPIAVTVQNRVVILEGAVDGPQTAEAIGEEAWSTPAVLDVCNALVVSPDSYGLDGFPC